VKGVGWSWERQQILSRGAGGEGGAGGGAAASGGGGASAVTGGGGGGGGVCKGSVLRWVGGWVGRCVRAALFWYPLFFGGVACCLPFDILYIYIMFVNDDQGGTRLHTKYNESNNP
jgi:hypothetical protein